MPAMAMGHTCINLCVAMSLVACHTADGKSHVPNLATRHVRGIGTSAQDIHTVHLVFSHHLDVGLDLPLKTVWDCVGFATNIVQTYFDLYIPRVIRLANELRATGKQATFKYTVHAWIASLYVDCVAWQVRDGCKLNPAHIKCPTRAAVAAFDIAVRRGDIVFTASPFNINPEAVGEPGLFADLAGISSQLEARYNQSQPVERVWTNIDVKGFARSAVPLLKSKGVNTLYIGTNGGPERPAAALSRGLQPVVGTANATMFIWHDPPSNQSMLVLYHDGYGGYDTADTCVLAPNGVALASAFSGCI